MGEATSKADITVITQAAIKLGRIEALREVLELIEEECVAEGIDVYFTDHLKAKLDEMIEAEAELCKDKYEEGCTSPPIRCELERGHSGPHFGDAGPFDAIWTDLNEAGHKTISLQRSRRLRLPF